MNAPEKLPEMQVENRLLNANSKRTIASKSSADPTHFLTREDLEKMIEIIFENDSPGRRPAAIASHKSESPIAID